MLIKTGKKIDKKTLEKRLSEIPRKKVFRSELHKGALHWGEDPLAYQKRVRKEWDERRL